MKTKILIITILLTISTINASAYNLNPYKWTAGMPIPMQYDKIGSLYMDGNPSWPWPTGATTAMQSAINKWKASGANISSTLTECNGCYWDNPMPATYFIISFQYLWIDDAQWGEAVVWAGSGNAVEISLNEVASWTTGTPTASQYDLETAFLHAIGHGLGLANCTVSGAVMQEPTKGVTRRTLSTDDINGVKALYGSVVTTTTTAASTSTTSQPTTTTTRPTTTTTVITTTTTRPTTTTTSVVTTTSSVSTTTTQPTTTTTRPTTTTTSVVTTTIASTTTTLPTTTTTRPTTTTTSIAVSTTTTTIQLTTSTTTVPALTTTTTSTLSTFDVDFSADVLSGEAPLTVNFTNDTVGCNSECTDFQWDFGDGTILKDYDEQLSIKAKHIYEHHGSFTVKFSFVANGQKQNIEKQNYIIADSADPTDPKCPFAKNLSIEDANVYRAFRDNTLRNSIIGRKIIDLYYKNQESINNLIEKNNRLKAVFKKITTGFADIIK